MLRANAWLQLLACLWAPGLALAAEFHVSPSGSPGGDGSLARPWDLATALLQPAAVGAGDTLWLHGGTYPGSFASRLRGAAGNPIVLQGAPGEWARIDGSGSPDPTFEFHGEWAVFRDFEITHSDPERWGDRASGIDVYGKNLKLINLIIHDLGNNGFWTSAENSEIYGCLIYHIGSDEADRGHGHGLYSQNRDGTKLVAENILFGGYSFGIHVYTEGGSIQGYDFVGNIAFNAGVVSSVSGHKDDILIGGLQPADRILLRENLVWAIGGNTRSVQLGYGVPNGAVRLHDNYFIGALRFSQPWSSVVMTGNTLCTVSGVDTGQYPENTYLTSDPPEVRVFIRPNQYEPGRAHVAVYNWTRSDSVELELAGVLSPGDAFEVRNAQNYFAGPVLGGVFSGAPVEFPLTGLEPVQPIGSPGNYAPADQTGSLFNVFVVRRTASGSEPDGGQVDGDGDDGGAPDGGADDGGSQDDGDPGLDGGDPSSDGVAAEDGGDLPREEDGAEGETELPADAQAGQDGDGQGSVQGGCGCAAARGPAGEASLTGLALGAFSLRLRRRTRRSVRRPRA
jgi:hypothetical protein